MPIYAYRCAACGHAQDVLQKMSDPLLTRCPACGAEAYTKQVTAAGFQLKGSGWYVTDFRGGNNTGKKEAKDDAKGESGDKATDQGAEKSADKGADKPAEKGADKPAEKAVAKPAEKSAAPTPAPAPGPSPSPPSSGS